MFRKLWTFLFGSKKKKTEPQIKKPDVSQLRFPNKPIVPSTYRGNPTPVRTSSVKPVPQRRTTTRTLSAEPARVSSGSSYDPTLDLLTAAVIADALTPDTTHHSDGSNNWAGEGGASGGGGASASWDSSPSEPSVSSSYADSSSSYSSSSDSYSSSSSSSYSSDSYSSSSSYDSGSSYSSSDSSSSYSDSSW